MQPEAFPASDIPPYAPKVVAGGYAAPLPPVAQAHAAMEQFGQLVNCNELLQVAEHAAPAQQTAAAAAVQNMLAAMSANPGAISGASNGHMHAAQGAPRADNTHTQPAGAEHGTNVASEISHLAVRADSVRQARVADMPTKQLHLITLSFASQLATGIVT